MSDDHAIGLPPREGASSPSPETLRLARLVNVFGLFTPAANLGLVWTGPKDRKWFGLGAAVACAIAIGYAYKRDIPWLLWTAACVHLALVLAGLVNPLWVAKVGDAWAAFGVALGKVMVYPIFAAVYFVVVTPTALLFRMSGKDPLARKPTGAATYWTPHEPPGKEKYERQF